MPVVRVEDDSLADIAWPWVSQWLLALSEGVERLSVTEASDRTKEYSF